MSNFKALPQRRAHTHNASWTTDFMAADDNKVNTKRLAANRAKIAQIEAAVRSGKVKPRHLPGPTDARPRWEWQANL